MDAMIVHAPSSTALSTLALTATLLSAAMAAACEPTDLASWERVLKRFHRAGGLDYAALKSDPADLDRFLAALAEADLDAATRAETIAFWTNAYNAVTAHFVLERYPELESVRGVAGFFDRLRQRVAGEELTLDEIEQRALAPGDPRVHFAVVCASAGCPDLRDEPYVAARLDRQLEEQTRAFLANSDKGLRLDRDSNTLWLSSIFMWYADDFTGGSRIVAYFSRSRVLSWVVEHLPQELADEIAQRSPRVRYLDYDWSLNDRSAAVAADSE